MDRHCLIYVLLFHLKQGKCFMNCKLCCRIKGRGHLSRNIASSSRLHDKPTVFVLKEEDGKDLSRTQKRNEIKQKPAISGEINNKNMHTCASLQKLICEPLGQTQSNFTEDWLKCSLSFDKRFNILNNFSRGKCLNKLLHIAYINLKDNHLLPNLQNDYSYQEKGQLLKKCLQIHQKFPKKDLCTHCFEKYTHTCVSSASSDQVGPLSVSSRPSASSSISAKELFKCRMYNKYANPNPKQVECLSAMFQEPEKLVSAVVKHMQRADEDCAPQLVVTSHLQGFYWKACLTLACPHNVAVRGTHPDKDLAIHGAYLLLCEQLKMRGLVFRNKDGEWTPMTCDKVVAILETLSKYGESSIGSSRGRGFKIILEQIKDGKNCTKAKIDDEEEDNMNKIDMQLGQEGEEREKTVLDNISLTSGCNHSISNSHFVSHDEMVYLEAASEDLCRPGSYLKHKPRPRWMCTIHIGWPFPLSVQAEGLSLPAAQLMGYMSVITQLKLRGLLTFCNCAVSNNSLQELMLAHTRSHWATCIKMISDKAAIEDFQPDAEVFCDASVKGFGAFLSVNGTDKVSWLSEEWNDNQVNLPYLKPISGRNLNSMMAELFAVVTAVFTWKRKLRSRRLLCVSDNLIVMGFINSFASETLKLEACKGPLDYLMHVLQTTCREYSISLQATWLDREENWLADLLSRNNEDAFRAAVPEAAVNKTKAKKLKIKEGPYM